MKLVFNCVKDRLDRKFGCFEIFAFDFLIDVNLNPYLLEVTSNPAMYTETQTQKDLLPYLVDDVIKMALKIHQTGCTNGKEKVKAVVEGINE